MASFKRLERFLCTLIAVFILLWSFRWFAPANSPLIGSSHAIHVLMTADLQLPGDLYYWGQGRLGSIVPIIGHVLLTLLPISAVEAVSYAHYLLLLVGYLCFAGLFRSNVSRIGLALVWFLPFPENIALIRMAQPYGPQFAFLGIAAVLIDKLLNAPEKVTGNYRHTLIVVIVVSLFTSFWISDLSIFALLLIGGMIGFKTRLMQRSPSSTSSQKKRFIVTPELKTVLITALICFGFIRYAKSQSDALTSLYTFNDISKILDTISRLSTAFFHTLAFQPPNRSIFYSLHVIGIVALIAYAVALLWLDQHWKQVNVSRWCWIFLGYGAVTLLLIPLSSWVYRNDLASRYFTVPYISFWLAFLWLAEGLKPLDGRRLQIGILIVALFASLSLPDYVFTGAKLKSEIQQLQALRSLAPTGFIGNARVFVLCSDDPINLHCTTRDENGRSPCPAPGISPVRPSPGVRCKRCAKTVMAQSTIYLLQDKWFDVFPDSIEQFEKCLIRVSDPIKVGRHVIAPYQKRDEMGG